MYIRVYVTMYVEMLVGDFICYERICTDELRHNTTYNLVFEANIPVRSKYRVVRKIEKVNLEGSLPV